MEALGYFTIVYCLFLIDTFSQITNNKVGNRKVMYSISTFGNRNFHFFIHIIMGIIFPAIILLILLKWYWAILLYFILVQIIFKINTYVYDRNLNLFKIIVLSPKFFSMLSVVCFCLFIYLKFLKD